MFQIRTLQDYARQRPSQGYALEKPKVCPSKFTLMATNGLKRFANWWTDHSIFHAMDGKRIKREFKSLSQRSFLGQFTHGMKEGVRGFIPHIGTAACLSFAVHSKVSETVDQPTAPGKPLSFFSVVIVAPLLEEVLFRGIGQNSVAVVQKIFKCFTPKGLRGNRVFKWMRSPQARILLVNGLFAGSHYWSNQEWLGRRGAAVQSLLIMLYPTQSVLHETSNNIVAPMGSHIANNGIVWLIQAIATKKVCLF